jgi:alginate O-acetyltransferase complex protein AlgI
MLFNSMPFVVLVVATLLIYYFPPARRLQPIVLISASFLFYAYGQPALLLLLLASIGINVITSYQVAVGPVSQQRFWAVLGVGLNLGVLLVFKYSPLLARTFLNDLSTPHSIGHFLVTMPLPIGISFFTFQGISLVVEVYRRQSRQDSGGNVAELVSPSFAQHLGNTAFFKSFFPQLVAGPIVTAEQFYPQIGPKTLRDIDFNAAFRLLVVGYFLKMVVADNLADYTFWLEYPYFLRFPRATLMALLLGYSIQIFADFAGYSLIAIGLARLFGYRLPPNFNFPYLARSFSEFWRRWHMSLSNWLRCYLYYPLGGNRKGEARTYLNLFVVMFLGGLWHGAAWSYAIWGTFHGCALAGERLCRRWLRLPKNRWIDALRIGIVFSFVTLAWLLFKLPKIEHVGAFVKALVRGSSDPWFFELPYWLFVYSVPVLIYYALHIARHRPRCDQWLSRCEFALIGTMLAGIILNSGSTTRFIYFQF